MRYLIIASLTALSLTACTAQDLQAPPTQTASTAQTATPASVNPCDSSLLPFGGGSGTAGDPYLICSSAQLQSLAAGAYTYTHAAIEADLFITGSLGNFYGTLEGNGHTMGGLSTTTHCGLFDELFGTVKNLTLQYMTVHCPGSGGGALVGVLNSQGVVDNVVVHDSTVTGTQAIGGVIGTVYGSATQVYSWTTTVNASSYDSGGLAGQVESGGVLIGNSASGSYSASLYHGFVAGTVQGTVTCISAAGHSWPSVHSVGFVSGGTTAGCP